MAVHHKYLIMPTGERVNFATVRYYVVNGTDVDIFWSDPIGMTDKLVVPGGQVLFDQITEFIDETYDRDVFIRQGMRDIVNGIFAHPDILSALSHAEARQGESAVESIKDKVFRTAAFLADKWEEENP